MKAPPSLEQRLESVRQSALTAAGETTPELRQSIARVAAAAVRGQKLRTEVDPRLTKYAEAVAVDPLSADVEGLIGAGLSDDRIFELTVVAAVAAAAVRAEHALALLDESDGRR